MDVDISPLEYLILSIFWIASSPSDAEYFGCLEFGFTSSFAVKAACLPKITISRSEFAPNLLAPKKLFEIFKFLSSINVDLR